MCACDWSNVENSGKLAKVKEIAIFLWYANKHKLSTVNYI